MLMIEVKNKIRRLIYGIDYVFMLFFGRYECWCLIFIDWVDCCLVFMVVNIWLWLIVFGLSGLR